MPECLEGSTRNLILSPWLVVFLGWQLSGSHEVALERLGEPRGTLDDLFVLIFCTPGKGAQLDWGMGWRGQETRREVQLLDRKSADRYTGNRD